MHRYLLPLLSAWIAACGGPDTPAENSRMPHFVVDPARITVSGVSAGAYMAGQLHIAHSATVHGAGMLAGGPYWCAERSVRKGLGPCMHGGEIGLDRLVDHVSRLAAAQRIDDPANFADDPVWLFHGSLDQTVNLGVVEAAAAFYERLAPGINVRLVIDVAAAHGMPVIDSGIACDRVETPFLNACQYDAAGALLVHLYGPLNPRDPAAGELLEFEQPGHADAVMLPKAYVYVPPACAAGESCGVHIAFHGCQQSSEFVGDGFARSSGYNDWADSNRLLVLYPQVASSKLAPMNPLGCWDWWGYTGEDYATRDGAQIVSVMSMLDELAGRNR